jgi:hypothetical protein
MEFVVDSSMEKKKKRMDTTRSWVKAEQKLRRRPNNSRATGTREATFFNHSD